MDEDTGNARHRNRNLLTSFSTQLIKLQLFIRLQRWRMPDMVIEGRWSIKMKIKIMSDDTTIPLGQRLLKLFMLWKTIDSTLVIHTSRGHTISTEKEFPSNEDRFLKAFNLDSIATDAGSIYVFLTVETNVSFTDLKHAPAARLYCTQEEFLQICYCDGAFEDMVPIGWLKDLHPTLTWIKEVKIALQKDLLVKLSEDEKLELENAKKESVAFKRAGAEI